MSPTTLIETSGGNTVVITSHGEFSPGELPELNACLQQAQFREMEAHQKRLSAVREEIIPHLEHYFPPLTIPHGPYTATVKDLERCQQIFNDGRIEAIDASLITSTVLGQTLAMITPVAVNHLGQIRGGDTMLHSIALASRPTGPRGDLNLATGLEDLKNWPSYSNDDHTNMAARQLMSHAERELLENSSADFKIGHGVPISVELTNKAADPDQVMSSLPLVESIVSQGQFAYVPSESNRSDLITIASSLEPHQYAGFENYDYWFRVLRKGNYGGRWKKVGDAIEQLAVDLKDKLIVGGFKSSKGSPGRLFICSPQDLTVMGPLLIADSLRSGPRGFPSLISLADKIAGRFSTSYLHTQIDQNYSIGGSPFIYREERSTRS